MKISFTIVLLLVFVTLTLGQTTTSTPPKKVKEFGYSLEKYKKKKSANSSVVQKNEELNDNEIIQVKTNLILNNVLVTDRNGNAVTLLKKEDFVVTENGTPQTIEVFSPSQNNFTPRSVILIIDCSAAQAPYLKNSIEAAKILIDKLDPQDEAAIVTANLNLRIGFTTNKLLLEDTLNALEKRGVELGSGAEFSTLLAALNEMFDKKDRRRFVIFQGDGNEIIWLKPDGDAPYNVSRSTRNNSGMIYGGKLKDYGFSEVREAIEKLRVTIFSVITGLRFIGLSEKERTARAKTSFENTYRALGFEEKNLPALTKQFQATEAERQTVGQMAMSKTAELSGGETAFIETPKDAKAVYTGIFNNIKNRYVIGYYPNNQEQSGQRRYVKIEVRDHPEYIISGQKTYILY